MNFASDNTGPVHPTIMAAVMAANDGYAMPYGNDATTQAAREAVRTLFEAPSGRGTLQS
jgi:threonine aldolase